MGNVFNYREQGLALGDFVAVVIAPTNQCLRLTFPGQAIALNPLVSSGAESSRGLEGSASWGTQCQAPSAEPCPRGNSSLQKFWHRKAYGD